MTPERWSRIEEVFNAAIDLPAADQGAFIARACGDDADLNASVAALIAGSSRARESLHGAVAAEVERLAGETASALVGRRFGAYRLGEPLGEGGMGTVYLATRDDAAYESKVAIKVLQRVGSEHAVARFRDERQILAALDHPSIVRLLDGGSTDDGVPYLVMEYIEGVPITRYVRDRDVPVDERIELVRRVCAAVQYAHGKLVVHRDLKPSNILVGADGSPKLLDFGIAKLLEPVAGVDRVAKTRTGVALLTPEYASPEQARGEPVSTATDVYSLGAILYELLAGTPSLRMTGDALETLRLICEVDPPRPSTVAPRELRGAIAGDLDNIVMKAMHKEPSRRYASVEQLAADLGRHLDRLPVTARTATLGYRSGKFVRRNRGKLALAAVAVGALAALTAVSVDEARRADDAARRAERRFAEVRKLANALVFEIDDKIRDLKGATAARELVVSKALVYLDGLSAERDDDPALDRELALAYMKIGDIQGLQYEPNLGHAADGLVSYRKARAILDRSIALGHDDPATRNALAASLFGIGGLQQYGAAGEARTTLESALAIAAALPGDHQVPRPMVFRGYMALAQMAMGTDLAAATRYTDTWIELAQRWRATDAGSESAYWLGMALENRAMLIGMTDPDRAVGDAGAAADAFARLATEHPDDVRYLREQGTALGIATALLGGIGIVGDGWVWFANIDDRTRAEATGADAVAIAEKLRRDPDDSRAAIDLATALAGHAALVAERDPAASIPMFERSLAIDDTLSATTRAESYNRQMEWFAHCAMAVPLAKLDRRTESAEQARIGLAMLDAFEQERLVCTYEVARAAHVLGDDARAGALIDQVVTVLASRIAARSTVTSDYVGFVAGMELLAAIRPKDACTLHARALDGWLGWPGPATAYTRRQIERVRDLRCPQP